MTLEDANVTLQKIDKTWKGRRKIEDLKGFLNKTFPKLKELPNYQAVYESKGVWTCLTNLDKNLLEIDFYARGQADIFSHASMMFRRFKDLDRYWVDLLDFRPERNSFLRALRITLIPQGTVLAAVTMVASGIGGLPSVGPFWAAGIGAAAIILVYVPVAARLNMKEPDE